MVDTLTVQVFLAVIGKRLKRHNYVFRHFSLAVSLDGLLRERRLRTRLSEYRLPNRWRGLSIKFQYSGRAVNSSMRPGEQLAVSSVPKAVNVFGKAICEHLEIVRKVKNQLSMLEAIAEAMVTTLRAGGKILWCGNGSSAADSQHLAAEIIGRFRRERGGLPSIALTTDTSILTAVANDYGYDAVFSRQVEALGRRGDLLVGISTSGCSRNIVAALEVARSKGLVTVAFTGAGGGEMALLADCLFAVASEDTARVQEAHILAGHMLCDWIELDVLEVQKTTAAKCVGER